MRALTPRRLAHTGKASLLALLCRPSIPSPTTSWARTSPSHPRRCVRPGVATQASSWDRELAAPQRRNGFVILRAARSPPAASHPASRKTSQLDDAVACGYMWRDLTWVGLSPPDKATSQTHGPRLRGDDSGWVRAQSLACLAVDFFTGAEAGTNGRDDPNSPRLALAQLSQLGLLNGDFGGVKAQKGESDQGCVVGNRL
jgi:hypothetical protein